MLDGKAPCEAELLPFALGRQRPLTQSPPGGGVAPAPRCGLQPPVLGRWGRRWRLRARGVGHPDTSVGPLPTRPGALLVQKLGFGAWRGSGSGAVFRGRCSRRVFSMRNRAATGAEPGWRAGAPLGPQGCVRLVSALLARSRPHPCAAGSLLGFPGDTSLRSVLASCPSSWPACRGRPCRLGARFGIKCFLF